MKTRIFLLICSIAVLAPKSASLQADASGVYNIRTFGARGDGKTLDTPAVNKAIEAAVAGGGGTVRFPAVDNLTIDNLKIDTPIATA